MVKSKFIMIVVASVMLFTTLLTPGAAMAQRDSSDERSKMVNINGDSIELTVLEDQKGKAKFRVKGQKHNDLVEVDYDTGNFNVTKKDGTVEKYNVSDFVSDKQPADMSDVRKNIERKKRKNNKIKSNVSPEKRVPFESLIKRHNNKKKNASEQQVSLQASDEYITDINRRVGFTGESLDWNHTRTITTNPSDVFVYEASKREVTEAAKKYEFSESTAISVILGTLVGIVGFQGALTVTLLTAFMEGLGIAIVSEELAYAINPSIEVIRYNDMRAFYVSPHGFTTVTKSWENYIAMITEEGEVGEELYSEHELKTWYNDLPSWQVADVAYGYYEYIENYTINPPNCRDFNWCD